MKKLAFLLIAPMMIGMAWLSDASAQSKHAKKQWKAYEKQEKKRHEYYRERAKRRDEYLRERGKKRDEHYREQAKRRKEYYKDRDRWDDDRWYDDDRYGYHHRGGPPPWAPAHGYRAKHHVYFQDYYTFYDPYREGYVYWYNDDWAFSRAVPSFMADVDLGTARVQIMGDIPLSRHPEQYFDDYASRYPRNPSVRINLDIFAPLNIR